jgi:hypothetical protein
MIANKMGLKNIYIYKIDLTHLAPSIDTCHVLTVQDEPISSDMAVLTQISLIQSACASLRVNNSDSLTSVLLELGP